MNISLENTTSNTWLEFICIIGVIALSLFIYYACWISSKYRNLQLAIPHSLCQLCNYWEIKIYKHFLILCMKGSDAVKWHCLCIHNCVIGSFQFYHIHILLNKFIIQLVTNLVYMLVLCHKDFFPLFLDVYAFLSLD